MEDQDEDWMVVAWLPVVTEIIRCCRVKSVSRHIDSSCRQRRKPPMFDALRYARQNNTKVI